MSFYFILISVIVLVLAFLILSHLAKPKCGRCEARALNYMHLRVDGNPDLRYKNNPIMCYRCGATEASIRYEAIKKVNEHKVTKNYQSAHTGDASAQFKLGNLYSIGIQVSKDEAKAREWYEKAAAQNHAGAQFALGTMYFYGTGGVRQDLSIAKDFYKKSCDNGYEKGCEEYNNLKEVGY